MPMLNRGDRIGLKGTRFPVEILDYIAGGGQGEVYRAKFNNSPYALKWYRMKFHDAFYDNLARNIELGSPADMFLWPLAITNKINDRFGYVMRLKPEGYRDYGEFLTGEARFATWETLITAALNLTESFLILHSRGYSYQDLNEGSFFIHPDNGSVLICDNDNVSPFGVNLGVKGMPKYMAPEVVMNIARPNTHTDRFSLAIILFRLFYIDHPLEGKYTVRFPITDVLGPHMFGDRAVFVYDPSNDINRPVEGVHNNVIYRWNMFPIDLKAAFIKVFTHGLMDIDSRATEQQWIETLVRTRGMLVNIGGREQFVNAYDPKNVPKECRILRTEESIIALAPESRLYECQINRKSVDFKTVTAVVKASGSNKNVYGLGNLSGNSWTASLPGRKPAVVGHKAFVPLIPGTIIDFGNIRGKVLL